MNPNGKHRLIMGLLRWKGLLPGPSAPGARPRLRRRVLLLALSALMAGSGAAGTGGLSRNEAPAPASPALPAPARTAQEKAALTVPGMPGTPQAPTVVFSEGFENATGATPLLLPDYVGVNGETYTADPPWLINCNGIITAYENPPSTDPASAPWVTICAGVVSPTATPGAAAWDDVRNLAYALGVVNGTPNPATNHAVSAFTNGANPGAGLIEFETVKPIPVTAKGRFLTFSVNAAEMSCTAQPAGHSMLEFFLVNDTGAEIPAFSSPIIPCNTGTVVTTPGPVTSPILAGHFVSNGSVLFTGTSLGIRMRNAQGSGLGNDHAFDDVQVLDVTPQLDKSFSPTTVPVGGTSTLTFTITNTSELAAKDGWSFTDHLPAGLVLATPSAGTTDCPGGVVAAPDGGTSISLTGGDLDAGEVSCTVTVNVTSDTPATFTNDAANITSTGLNPPAASDVTFVGPAIGLVKSVRPSSFSSAGTVLHYSFLVTNTGNVPVADLQVVDTDLPGLSAILCPSTTVPVGASVTCSATYTTTQADVAAGAVTNTATALGVQSGTTAPVVRSPPSTAIARFQPFVPVTG
jgi:uncharacterized repeat protein (TIGR01451 family)